MNERSDRLLRPCQQSPTPALGEWIPASTDDGSQRASLAIIGLFAGIGGFEEGFCRAGHHATFLCDADPAARRVLARRFPGVELTDDIRPMTRLPEGDVITAGFPCQDLSQVGRTRGISGAKSSLITEVFRLLVGAPDRIKWLVLENVPFMLRLHEGRAIREITQALSNLRWQWAYRTVDTRAFGLPQRRRRVILLASRTEDPRPALLGDDAGESTPSIRKNSVRGFYWTEGHRGLGWAVNAIPPLKGGSGLAIPSPPAMWFPGRRAIVVPSIEDAERLQGFEAGWTEPAGAEPCGDRCRWRLVGNAVSVPVAGWLADRLCQAGIYDAKNDLELATSDPWPDAAWGYEDNVWRSSVSAWPVALDAPSLASFVRHPLRPLSLNASAGFLSRLEHSPLRVDEGFLTDLRMHVEKAKEEARPNVVDPKISKRMAATRGRDNAREVALRSALHRRGFRFRVHLKLLKGLQRTADIAFPSLKIAIFLDGCFWHGCPIHGTWPKNNAEWWREKILTNRKRGVCAGNQFPIPFTT
jgi:DNA (cytosine-5)-methyltransferase 1